MNLNEAKEILKRNGYSDTIDDITKQSHTHSVVLDTIRGK